MRYQIYTLLAALVMSARPVAARDVTSLNFGWEFTGADSLVVTVDLPHDFQISQPWVTPDASELPDASDAAANRRSRLSARGFKEVGCGTYRKVFIPDDSLRGKRVVLDFGGIMLTGDVWLNGKRVGGTDYGYVGFDVDITDHIFYGRPNEIVVTADTGEPNNSRWYTGGGLIRGVDMVVTDNSMYLRRDPLNIITDTITPQFAKITVEADINVRKPHKGVLYTLRIIDPDGKEVSFSRGSLDFNPKWRDRTYSIPSISILYPRPWSCESPALYTACLNIADTDGVVRDSYSQTFGLRTLDYSPEHGLRLNGEKVLLKGIANHHDLGILGAAAYPAAIEKRIKLLKDFGFNHIRTSHNPYSREFYDLCDKYGILVVDELYDKWLTQYTGGRAEWTSLWQHDIPLWVKAHRNHPSVVMWSLGNELQGYSNLPYNDWGVTAYRLQKTLLDKYDTTRPVTVAMHPRYRSLEGDSLPAPLALETDIAAYNYRYMYFPEDAKRYPSLIFYQSEANLSNMGPNFYSPDNDKVVGLAYWGMIDYLGESQGWPEKGWTNGVFDITLEPKADAWMLKAMFDDTPTVHIGVVESRGKSTEWNGVAMPDERPHHYWNLIHGDTVKVYTYTNADEVALLLNGRVLGRKPNIKDDPQRRGRILWEGVPYSPGKLEAVAYTDGREVARHRIETAGKPVRLVADIDNDAWRADGLDLQHIAVYAIDSKGRRCPMADDLLRFSVSGPAALVGVGNGDMASGESYTGDTRSLYQGAAAAVLRAGREPGDVVLKVTSENFKPLEVKLITR